MRIMKNNFNIKVSSFTHKSLSVCVCVLNINNDIALENAHTRRMDALWQIV